MMTELIAPLASLALSAAPAIVDALSPSSPATKDTNLATQPLPSTDGVVLSHQSLPPSPPLPLGSSLGRSSSGIVVPFQSLIFDLTGTETKSASFTIQGLTKVAALIKPFRDATITSLEAIVFPSAPSLKIPVTVDLAWTTADLTVEGTNVLATPASARITVGGLQLLHQGILPADLGYINPIIKCPIPYTNHPRLNIYFHQNSDAVSEGTAAKVKATVFVRGTLRLSHPILTP